MLKIICLKSIERISIGKKIRLQKTQRKEWKRQWNSMVAQLVSGFVLPLG